MRLFLKVNMVIGNIRIVFVFHRTVHFGNEVGVKIISKILFSASHDRIYEFLDDRFR